MDQLEQVSAIIALTMGVGWASGINLYATILMLGLMSNMGHLNYLPGLISWEIPPMVLMAAGLCTV